MAIHCTRQNPFGKVKHYLSTVHLEWRCSSACVPCYVGTGFMPVNSLKAREYFKPYSKTKPQHTNGC